jgi:hypothetical protein
VQRKPRRRRGLMLLLLACGLVAMLFFFEWLGSEQPQKWVESPIAVPPDEGDTGKSDGKR